MGGIAFVNKASGIMPIIWHHPFLWDIQKHLVTAKNPMGTISNSDLELAAAKVYYTMLCHHGSI